MATETNITIYRGEDIPLDFTVSPTTDITGWTIAFKVAEAKNSTSKLIEKTCSHLIEAAGTFRATLASADTNIAPGTYYWDVYRTDSGYVRCLGFGSFTIKAAANYPASA